MTTTIVSGIIAGVVGNIDGNAGAGYCIQMLAVIHAKHIIL